MKKVSDLLIRPLLRLIPLDPEDPMKISEAFADRTIVESSDPSIDNREKVSGMDLHQ